MATSRSIAFGSGNGNNEVDMIDVAALMLLPMAASFIFEVFTFEINVFTDYDITEPIWTIGGADITVVLLLVIFSMGWIVATNLLNSETDHGPYELALLVVALALPLGVVFVPAIESLVFWNDLAQLASLLYVSAASVVVSYMG